MIIAAVAMYLITRIMIMDNAKAAELFLNGSNVTLNNLLEEIEREGYETVAQVIGSIHGFIEINKGLAGDQHE